MRTYPDEERRLKRLGGVRLQITELPVPVHRAAPVHHLQQLLQQVAADDVRSGQVWMGEKIFFMI